MSADTAATTGVAAHQVALSFEDGVTRFITCRADQTVADASYRQRINIPLDCRDGACGTCKAFCESGEFDGGSYLDDALPVDEAQRGFVLPCSMRPRSDLVLQIASTSEVAKTRAESYAGKVAELQRLSATTVQLSVAIPNRGDLAFLPGQYVNIAVPGTDVSRSYSFSNAPHEELLTFLIKITPGGVMSDYLTGRAAVGDELTFTGPNGSFFLRETDRPALLLAGGTGLAPVLSMIRKLRAEGSQRRVHLVYGVSTDEDLVALDQIEQVAADLPGLTWDHCVADPNSTAANKGYVTSLIRPEHLNGGDVAVYLCGPPPMVEAVRRHVADEGIEPTGFYYEKFALAVPAADAPQVPDAPATAPPPVEELIRNPEARNIAGQVVLPDAEIGPWSGAAEHSDPGDAVRRIAGQLMGVPAAGTDGPVAELDPDRDLLVAAEGRGIAGQEMFPAFEQAPATAPETTAPDGYQIGEEHPDVQSSDALFEARQALELGALELTVGRLSSQQLAGYRLLAELTLPHVEGDRFVDAAAYTETNAAFHDYLFTLTGNEHLLHAYQALGVKGRMAEVLRNATWCHPRCATDHVEIVEAFERGDRDGARALVVAHAERSKQTMRRAMADAAAGARPRFVTPGRFSGKVVVVTGSAQGIGAQVARRIAAEGGELVLADRSELVGEVAEELVRHGGSATPVVVDLESWDGAASLVDRAIAQHGRIDVLVNNVGGAINFKPFTEFTDAEIRAELDRSLLTTLFACRAVLPGMVAAGSGVIVNVSSAATRGIHRIPYSAAKGGINAITASLALECADRGIRVVATAPGGTEAPPRRIPRGTPEPRDDRERAWFQAHIDQTIASSPMHRYGTLDEQAAAIAFLASDEASYITGTVLPVAGGDLG
ncbi:benzoate 1,2-dioxygenase electron transfer component BenC [Saccharopolyspora hirsuta]|uniref:1,6-dihydroxycyclohexa-2,4-diene-1-carboxylate dehydrogenase n=1 Tax=Saccharopolyspora hirsuta TaxID=1837 RepID=A0A5M7C4E2_SACHI|nr:benzoate 1,2-dioxygenase electron transfer component BenC [Saccharopolyspora hirsuta]KAA5835138.1 1,6-dihydroxycyclohexa-2,4-diene-1-carboxylate dehydrogenase [Saccharopolyspora hirsuta]